MTKIAKWWKPRLGEGVFLRQPFVNFIVVCTNTPLHEACSNGKSPEVVEALLAAGANVNATIVHGTTPLMPVATANAPITS